MAGGAGGLRRALAQLAARGVNATSRTLGRGAGTVIGGRAALAIDPDFVAHASVGRRVVLVSGTNGKTTTSALVAAALRSGGDEVASNATGSNMPAGHAAALAGSPSATWVVLETDEAYLPATITATNAVAVTLLNLSRDQLDRSAEVRLLAERWREALASYAGLVVANADDPLVAWAAEPASSVAWVAGGLAWREDARSCPWCGGSLSFAGDAWSCGCGASRPAVAVQLRGDQLTTATATTALSLKLPGEFNRGNAALAVATAEALGCSLEAAAASVAEVAVVAGRFGERLLAGRRLRTVLAKNPAGWSALIDETEGSWLPLVLALNARSADGTDPSWIYDVPFERLAGRRVVATGERRYDLSVRLSYAGVDHELAEGAAAAVALAAPEGAEVEFIGNYTAFHDLGGLR